MSHDRFNRQKSIEYAAPNSPTKIQRPVAVSLLSLLGLIVGSGLFFLNIVALAFEVQLLRYPNISAFNGTPPLDPLVVKIFAANAALGFIFGAVLIGACLAALHLRPAARKILLIWSVLFVIWGACRTIAAIRYVGPAELAWMNRYHPEDTGFASGQMANTIVPKAIGGMALFCILPSLYVFFWNRPGVKTAFDEADQRRLS